MAQFESGAQYPIRRHCHGTAWNSASDHKTQSALIQLMKSGTTGTRVKAAQEMWQFIELHDWAQDNVRFQLQA